ncbi:hypothetical protein D7B24_008899 [Verticillium nonalfalfae]|uniref:Uncharacterized protein n=1 Tax=Verticillium nonalfalfae TaxID=1051616 RepID=A0A3M9Y5B5_9PEZI|nr:uncharacterized protein D7B24_008899 [Verticillium nonalfalfae]RNJ55202.1 hypothetical protein D7B24_008899 [Verticillium nonalfalfae]
MLSTSASTADDPGLYYSNDKNNNEVHQAYQARSPTPYLAAGVDDWAPQGVNITFFDNFMRGASSDIMVDRVLSAL